MNMKNGVLLSILVFLSTLPMVAQQQLTLYGFVFDADTKEILIGAVVQDSVSGKGVITNEHGFFSLIVSKQESVFIHISYIGYEKKRIQIDRNKDSRSDFYLKPGIELNEVTVSSSRYTEMNRSTETNTVRLPMRDIKNLPNLFGEVDIIKAYQLTPGVQSGGEGKSELYVRGGSPDQNLVLLDDVPLYYVAHFGGFFSIFNADAINDSKLIKGGFPARYGGRLSSVLDIRMKDGNMEKISGAGSIGLLSAKLMIEGPLLKNKSSFMISVRKNLFSPFYLAGADIKYSFYDLNAKFNYRLSEKDRLFFSIYAGNDAVKIEQQSKNQYSGAAVRWGNLAMSLRYNRIFNEKLFGSLIFASTRYKYTNSFENEMVTDTSMQSLKSNIFTGINDIILKSDIKWMVTNSYKFQFGFSGVYHNITPNDEDFEKIYANRSISRNYNFQQKAFENALYIENEFNTTKLGFNAGLRFVQFLILSKNYCYIEPRLNLNIPIRENTSIKAAYAFTNQFLHLLSYSGAGMPADYWMPSTDKIKPSQANQYSIGLAKSFREGMYQFSVDAYYKQLDGLIAFKPGTSLIGNLSSWENVVVTDGIGVNYGIEIFLQRLVGRSTGWAGLTLSKAERQFADLNKGEVFPFKYDRLLDFSFVWNYHINEKLNISTTWTYGSGYPITLATDRYNTEDGEVFVYDKINSFRMRDYHRLDFAINFTKKKRWGIRVWTISVFNLYNRKNPFYYYYQYETPDASPIDNTPINESSLKLYQKTLFGFFPSVSYHFKF